MIKIAIAIAIAIASALFSLGLSTAASAQICPAYPANLTNGSTADATQITANFNNILNCFNNHINSGGFLGNIQVNSNNTFNPSANASSAVVVGPPSGAPWGGGILMKDGTSYAGLWTNFNGGALNLSAGGSLSGFSVTAMGVFSNGGISVGSAYSDSIPPANGAVIEGAVGIGQPNPGFPLTVNGTAGGTSAWVIYSDERLKTAIEPIASGLDVVMRLRPVRFKWRAVADRAIGQELKLSPSETHVGFIAQEVQTVIPEVVAAPSDRGGIYGLKEADLIPVLVAAVKEQQAVIDALTKRMSTLEAAR